MTDEIKVTEEVKCNCKEKAIAKLKEFLFIAGAVFVGGTLSILVAANLLKPHHPMGPRPGIHRQLPPPMMHRDFDRGMIKKDRGGCPCQRFKKHHRGEFKGKRGEFRGHRGPHHWEKRPPVQPQEKVKETK